MTTEPRVWLVDNYDSFTWNLAQLIAAAGAEVRVERNDASELSEIEAWSPTHVVLSPGPGSAVHPSDLGVCGPLIAHGRPDRPLLGVCLGHQALAYLLGAEIQQTTPIHGKASLIRHDGDPLFTGISSPFHAMRYHSLTVAPASLPPALRATAWADDGALMAIAHRERPWFGVQFHPESVGTPAGPAIIRNFLRYRDQPNVA
jgi:anthranilate synthase component 2